MVTLPTADTRWRCSHCGNLTRFDVRRMTRVREYWHTDLAGEPTIEETTVLAEDIEAVTCRWCGAADSIELIARLSEKGSELLPPHASQQGSAQQ